MFNGKIFAAALISKGFEFGENALIRLLHILGGSFEVASGYFVFQFITLTIPTGIISCYRKKLLGTS